MGAQAAAPRPGNGVMMPAVLSEVKLHRRCVRQKIQGVVMVEAVVMPMAVSAGQVVRSLDRPSVSIEAVRRFAAGGSPRDPLVRRCRCSSSELTFTLR